MKFIYVFDVASRDELLERGYALIRSDERKNIYVFGNRFVCDEFGFDYVLSNTLTF